MKAHTIIIRTESWPSPTTQEIGGFTSHIAARRKADSIVESLQLDAVCKAMVSYKIIEEDCCSNPFCANQCGR